MKIEDKKEMRIYKEKGIRQFEFYIRVVISENLFVRSILRFFLIKICKELKEIKLVTIQTKTIFLYEINFF